MINSDCVRILTRLLVRFRVDTSSSAAFLLRERKHTHVVYERTVRTPGTKAWLCVRVLHANQSDVVLCTGTVCKSVRLHVEN
jgi:hypothetical protein